MAIPCLRPYQTGAIEAVRDAYAAGHRSALICLPTGTGKTIVFAEIARLVVEKGGRVLVVAHRAELLDQAAGKLRAVGIEPGIERADRRAGDAAVVVASAQALRGPRLATFAQDAFRLVVVDEAHHATAAGYRALMDRFPDAYRLGVTATPDRLDGAALGAVFATCAYRYELRDAIRDGWLARIEARRVRLSVDLDGVRTRAGDLDVGQLESAYGTEAAIRGVVEPLLELAGGLRTIVFAVSVAHAERLASALNTDRPGSARALSGETPATERDDAVEGFRRGDFQTLVNCALFTEGFDCPEVECIAIARPTKSRALYAQMIGRGTRLAPGKDRCLVLDFVGATRRHRLIGPADVLAGVDDDDEVVDAAAAVEGDVLAALAGAREDARTAASRPAPATLRFWSEAADVFGVSSPGYQGGAPATDRQLERLHRAGLCPPLDTTRSQASRLIEGVIDRQTRGLATFKQIKLLRRAGIDARQMTFTDASDRISVVVARWDRKDDAA